MIPEKPPPYDIVPLACCSGHTPLQDYLDEEDDNNSTRASTSGYCFSDMSLMSVL